MFLIEKNNTLIYVIEFCFAFVISMIKYYVIYHDCLRNYSSKTILEIIVDC